MRLDGNKISLKSCLIQTNGTEMAPKNNLTHACYGIISNFIGLLSLSMSALKNLLRMYFVTERVLLCRIFAIYEVISS